MSFSDSPPSSKISSSSENEGSGDSSPPSLESSSSPPSQGSSSSPPSPESSSSPPPPMSVFSSPPSSNTSTLSPPSNSSHSLTPGSSSSSSSSPSPPSLTPPPPPSSSGSNSPSQGKSSDGDSAPPFSSKSGSSPPPPPPPPPPNAFVSHNSSSSSSSSSPSPPSLTPPPSPLSSSESDSPSQGKSSDGDSSPPVSTKSGSSPPPPTRPPPPNAFLSDNSSSSPSSFPPPPSRENQKIDEAPPADNEKPLSKPSNSNSSQKSADGSLVTPSDSSSSAKMPARSTPRLSPPSLGSSKVSFDRGGTSTGAVVSLVLVGVAITLMTTFFVISRRKKKRMDAFVDHYQQPPSFSAKSDTYNNRNENLMARPHFSDPLGQVYNSGPDPSGSKSCFSYEELMDITNGFSIENLLGEGGFGCVYKGTLPDGKQVAVKQLKAGSGQGEREFRAEVEIISRVHHRHLVSLVGYSISETQRLLVYEFVTNNTLEHHLHGNRLPIMDWPKRLKIAIGSAKGLAYLHDDCHPRIIHRDIKSANILIDNDWEAQVADFGLAKLSNDAHTHVSTRVMGTFGYLAPEYASSGKLTDKSDVFSFGVVLLELITGRKPVDASQPLGDESLVEWARPLLIHALETGNCDQLVDQRLENCYAKIEIFRMIEAAAACVRHSAPKRPRMTQVVRALDCEGDMADLSNGMKFGQSQAFDSGHYSDIQRLRRTALGTDAFSSAYGNSNEYDRRSSSHSGEHRSHEYQNQTHGYQGHAPQNREFSGSWRSRESSGEYSGEAETRPMFRRPGERSDVGSYRYGNRGFS